MSRQHNFSPGSPPIIGTHIGRHRELIVRIKEEVVFGASWGHSSGGAMHYLLGAAVLGRPRAVSPAACRLHTKRLSSSGMSRLQLAQKDWRRKNCRSCPPSTGFVCWEPCLLTLCCPQSCQATGTGANDQVFRPTLRTQPTGAQGHPGMKLPATSPGQWHLSQHCPEA